MDNLDRARLESFVDGLCGGEYTPAGNSFIIDANIDPDRLKSAFASKEPNITLLPLEYRRQTSPFGRVLVESVSPAKTSDDLEDIATALSKITDMEIDKVNKNKIKLYMTDWNEKADRDVRKYLKLHPEVKWNMYQDELEIALK